LRVGTDHAHARSSSQVGHTLLLRDAVGRADLAEARGHNDGHLDTRASALFHRFQGEIAGHYDDGDFGRLGQRCEIRVDLEALRLAARGIDGVDLTLEAEAGEIQQRPAADLVGILRCPDDRHRFGVQYRTQACARVLVHALTFEIG
jgi:hypothetical protein